MTSPNFHIQTTQDSPMMRLSESPSFDRQLNSSMTELNLVESPNTVMLTSDATPSSQASSESSSLFGAPVGGLPLRPRYAYQHQGIRSSTGYVNPPSRPNMASGNVPESIMLPLF